MKRHGFTLAEVLVTLGIIGVVAALTTPALIQNVGNAKVPPKLAKAKATFETAAEMMLTENSVNTILAVANDGAELGKQLGRYMKISRNDQEISDKKYLYYNNNEVIDLNQTGWARFDSDDGMTYWILRGLRKETVNEPTYTNIPNNQYIGALWIDVNGAEGPNRTAKDVFRFALYNDGTLRPWGGHGFYRTTAESSIAKYWDEDHNCGPDKVTDAVTCTGSIFDNGMKIVYQ